MLRNKKSHDNGVYVPFLCTFEKERSRVGGSDFAIVNLITLTRNPGC